jgi:3-dehydroquinate synthetase
VKIGLINDAAFFAWCERHGTAVIEDASHATGLAAHAIATAVEAKAGIVAADERESGVRALLNLGHTFAHAIEAEAGMDGAILHGEAVGCGLALAYAFSARLGHCPEDAAARVEAHMRAAGFETEIARLPGGPFDADRLVTAMMHDKKNEGGALTFILARGVGDAFLARDVDPARVHDFLEERLQD